MGEALTGNPRECLAGTHASPTKRFHMHDRLAHLCEEKPCRIGLQEVQPHKQLLGKNCPSSWLAIGPIDGLEGLRVM